MQKCEYIKALQWGYKNNNKRVTSFGDDPNVSQVFPTTPNTPETEFNGGWEVKNGNDVIYKRPLW